MARRSHRIRLHLVSIALSTSCNLGLAAVALASPWFQSPYLTFNVGTRPSSIAAGDLNEDDATDVVVNGAVMLSLGDGTFMPRVALPRDAFTVLGDLNGDGHLDVVLGGNPLSVLLGTGTGTWAPAINTAGTYGRMKVADMNRDGRNDVVTVGGWLPGNGDGTFGPLYTTPPAAFGLEDDLAIGDVNHDGYLDVVAPHTRGLSMHPCWSLWTGTGGALNPPVDMGTCGIGHPFHIAAGDLDGDGFAEVRTDAMEIGDLNGDGRNDVIDWSAALGGTLPIFVTKHPFSDRALLSPVRARREFVIG